MLFSLPTRSMNTVLVVALYTMNYLSSYRCWFLFYPKDIRHSTHAYESSVRIPPPPASTVFKHEIESERQVCKSCTSCECISFLAENWSCAGQLRSGKS